MSNQPEPGYKFVWYYGHKLEIPEDHYYVAMDESGWILSYRNQPIKNYDMNCWDCRNDKFEDHICKISGSRRSELDIYWQDTLVEYPTGYTFEEKK